MALPFTPVGGSVPVGSPVAGTNPVPLGLTDNSGNVQAAPGVVGNTLLTSAARTAAVNTADQVNVAGASAIICFNVAAASGTGGLKFTIQMKDPASGAYANLSASIPTSAMIAIGTYLYAIGTGCTTTSGLSAAPVALPLPSTWRLAVTVGDSSSYTYSVSASIAPVI